MGSKLRRLGTESLTYSLSTFAGHFVWVFLVPIYTRVFSPEEYGIIDLIATVVSFLTLFLYMGLDSATGRYYADSENDHDRRLTASTTLFYLIGLALVVGMIGPFFSKQLSQLILRSPTYEQILLVAMVSVPFSLINNTCLILFRFRFESTRFAITAITSLLFQTGLSIYLVVFLRVGIIGIYLAGLVNAVMFSCVNLWLTRSSFALVFSSSRLKELLFFGVPLIPLSLAQYITTYSNRYFLMNFLGLREVGLYGIGYKLSSLTSLLVLGFQYAWGPFVYSNYKDEDAKRMFANTYNYVSTILSFAAVILSLFAKEILMVFTTQAYVDAYKVVPFISASIVAYTLGGYFTIGIGIAKKNIHRAWGGITAALINLSLNYVLIPPLGMVGAAIAGIISFLVLGIVLMHISQRYYRVEYRFKANFTMYFIAALVILAAYSFFPSGLTFNSIGLKAVLLMGFLTVPFLLKLIDPKDIGYIGKLLKSRIRTTG
jgi:O-antigen/teichoic acid export membrane protein